VEVRRSGGLPLTRSSIPRGGESPTNLKMDDRNNLACWSLKNRTVKKIPLDLRAKTHLRTLTCHRLTLERVCLEGELRK